MKFTRLLVIGLIFCAFNTHAYAAVQPGGKPTQTPSKTYPLDKAIKLFEQYIKKMIDRYALPRTATEQQGDLQSMIEALTKQAIQQQIQPDQLWFLQKSYKQKLQVLYPEHFQQQPTKSVKKIQPTTPLTPSQPYPIQVRSKDRRNQSR